MKSKPEVKKEILREYRVIKEHSINCCIVGTEQLFYLLREPFFGNHVGHTNMKLSNYLWYPVICNDPRCEYRAIITDHLINYLICSLTNK